jgi:hypothetical protein
MILFLELMDSTVFPFCCVINVRINFKIWPNTFELNLQYLQNLCYSQVTHLKDYETPLNAHA